MKVQRISFLSPIEEVNPENDNIDVHAELDDGRVYSFDVATPNNIFWCMENEGVDYYFGVPPVFVKRLTPDIIKHALEALCTENGGRALKTYGVLQEKDEMKRE